MSSDDSDDDYGPMPATEQRNEEEEQNWERTVGASFSRDSKFIKSRREQRRDQKARDDRERELVYKSRELNPNLRGNKDVEEKKERDDQRSSSSANVNFSVDQGKVKWFQKALDRVYQQAKELGKSPEEVAAERWGSLAQLKQMLDEAKAKVRESSGSARSDRRDHSDRHRDRDDRHRSDRHDDRRRDDRRDDSRRDDNRRDERRSYQSQRESNASRSFRSEKNSDDRSEDTVELKRMDAAPKKMYTVSRPPVNDEPSQPEPEQPPAPQPQLPQVEPLSEKERNAIHAKILKAEMLGNTSLVQQLKDKLAYYDNLPKQQPSQPSASTSKASDEAAKPQSTEKQIKLAQKIKEESLSLKQMFMHERNLTMEDDMVMFAKSQARQMKGAKDADDEYDYERKVKRSRKQEDKDSRFYSRDEKKEVADCQNCPSKIPRHLIIASLNHVALHFNKQEAIIPGHCFITSLNHALVSSVLADEDALAEVNSIRTALTKLANQSDKSMVFLESYRKKTSSHRYHLQIECFPVPNDLIDETRMYFKKAIMECEGEWDMNKKLIELKGKPLGNLVPKQLPYFAVQFNSIPDGYAHVIEDEENFPRLFGHEIIAGVLDIEPYRYKKPRFANHDKHFEMALAFKSKWAKVNPF